MNTSQAWVEVTMGVLSCNQKELARRLGVSQTQISKWKNGEHMSFDMEEKFRVLANVGQKDPGFILWAGSLQNADKWERLIDYLAEWADEGAETGYDTDPLREECEQLCAKVSNLFDAIGVGRPESFPFELDSYFQGVDVGTSDEDDDEELEPSEELWDLLEENPYSAFIRAVFNSLNDVWGFYVAYVMNAADEDDPSLYDTTANIHAYLMDLAACKIEVDEKFAPKFGQFRFKTLTDYEKWLTTLKEAAFRAGIPLRAELLDMVGSDAGELGHAAEAESLGFNANRLHPDIYMNELLVGMRIIHQVLPVILKKLDIEDFRLDESELRINLRPSHTRARGDREEKD